MKQIDTDKIKAMVNDRIAYNLYERNRTMKKMKLKKPYLVLLYVF